MDSDFLVTKYNERRFRLNSTEKAAYALGFHAGMARATNRDPVRHVYDKSPRFPAGVNESHCGCPICCFRCDDCAEEAMRGAAEASVTTASGHEDENASATKP